MKKNLLVLLFGVCLAGSVGPNTLAARPAWAQSSDGQPITITGEIWDATCGANGSHGKMMTKLNAKDVKDCTLKCSQNGDKFVLFDLQNRIPYQLDDQDKAKQYAGQKVKVTGKYDKATNILHVDLIDSQ